MISKIKEKLRKISKLISEHGGHVKETTGKSKLRQFIEIIIYSRFFGFEESEYYVLSLYNGNKNYLSLKDHNNLVKIYNPPVRGQIEFNKYIFSIYMKAHNIPTPECFGIYHATHGFSEGYGNLRTMDDIRNILIKLNRPLVFKPVGDTKGGKGVIAIEKFDQNKDEIIKLNKKRISLPDFFTDFCTGTSSGVLIQEKVIQHETISRIHPSSVNCARIVTFRNIAGDIKIIGAVMKFGSNDKDVDNSVLSGGVFAPINIQEGTVGNACYFFGTESLTHHPFTNEKIVGLKLPFWNEMMAIAIKAHSCTLGCKTFGWDIAFGKDGPIVIEMNGHWEHNHLQKATGKSLKETIFANTLHY